MKPLPLLSTLAGGAILVGAAGAAEAQCFTCSESNPGSLYCAGGDEYGSCTTVSHTDPNSCQTYTTCGNVTSCSTSQDPNSICTNSTCDGTIWDFNSWNDIRDYLCYHYGAAGWCS
jgi:hypothetical protein